MRDPGAFVDPGIGREQLAEHHARCAPCRRLYGYARDRGDGEELVAWRRKLADHITADVERDAYRREVLAWLGVRAVIPHGSRDRAAAQIVHENGDSRRRS